MTGTETTDMNIEEKVAEGPGKINRNLQFFLGKNTGIPLFIFRPFLTKIYL